MSREHLFPDERKQLGRALAAAFDQDDLERLVSYSLDRELAVITSASALENVAFQLVSWAIRYGRLAALVEAAFEDNPDNPELRRFRYEVWETQETQAGAGARVEIRSALNAARARPAPPPAPPTEQKEFKNIDRDVLNSIDLLDQEFFIRNRVKPTTGVYAFALGGQRNMLSDYIIERIQKAIEIKDREIKRKDAFLVARALPTLPNGQSPIAPVIAGACECARVADLFDQPELDVLLVIWNYDIPLSEMKRMAIAFWDDLAAQVAAHIEGYPRRLIGLWVNSNKAPLDAFHVVPPIASFDVKEVTEVVKTLLVRADVDAKRIDYYVAMLEGLGGALPDSFDLMQQIVEEVSGGTAR